MTYSLKDLHARFQVCIALTSTERDAEGMYVWRSDDGEPCFWSPTPERYIYEPTDDIVKAHGLWFDCPKCFDPQSEYNHAVLVGFAGRNPPCPLSHGSDGQPTGWDVAGGSSLDDLVLTPSIQLIGGCNWHGFVGSSGIPPGHAG